MPHQAFIYPVRTIADSSEEAGGEESSQTEQAREQHEGKTADSISSPMKNKDWTSDNALSLLVRRANMVASASSHRITQLVLWSVALTMREEENRVSGRCRHQYFGKYAERDDQAKRFRFIQPVSPHAYAYIYFQNNVYHVTGKASCSVHPVPLPFKNRGSNCERLRPFTGTDKIHASFSSTA